MTVATALAYFRRRQEELFSDTCTITRASGDPVFNPATGGYTTPTPTEVFDGACLIRPADADEMAVRQFGETQVTVNRLLVKLPVDTDARIDDTMTVSTSEYDAGLVGRTFTVLSVQLDALQVCRRILCEEVT